MWNSLWYLQGGGGTTGVVLISGGAIMEPLQAELVDTTLEAELTDTVLAADLVPALEAEVE